MSETNITRPPFGEVLKAWEECLARHQLPTRTQWIFAENICLEPSRAVPGEFRLSYQTKFTPPPEDALEMAYDLFSEAPARLVLYRLGSNQQNSICMLFCDAWFEDMGPNDGYERHDEWGISFHPGQAGEIEEVTELARWLRRVKTGRPFHVSDFSMSLTTIDEIKLHGRALFPYERYAESMLNRLRRVLGNSG